MNENTIINIVHLSTLHCIVVWDNATDTYSIKLTNMDINRLLLLFISKDKVLQ